MYRPANRLNALSCPAFRTRPCVARKQGGVIIVIVLIVLVAMTLAGIGMVRSVDTGNLVAGNLAFRQGTIPSSDAAVETAIAWLTANANSTVVHADVPAVGYYAAAQTNPDWAAYDWNANAATLAGGAPDQAGNSVAYIVERLCAEAGDPGAITNQCGIRVEKTGGASDPGNSKGVGLMGTLTGDYQNYRVTVRVQGPKNAVSYVEALLY